MNILVSRKRAAELMGTTDDAVRLAISRGRVAEDDALIGETVRKGVTLKSLAAYCGWSPRTIDQICEAHLVAADSDGFHYLTTRDEA